MAVAREMNGVYIDCGERRNRIILEEEGIHVYADRHAGKLIVIDEVQRHLEMFSDIRGIIDERRRQEKGTGCFLLLGSAGIRVADESADSLYGRMAKIKLDPLDVLEIDSGNSQEFEKLWLRGGLPASFTAPSDRESFELRKEIVETLVGDEFAEEGIRVNHDRIHRLCVFLAHRQGDECNVSTIAKDLDMNRRTVRSCMDKLFGFLVARDLSPYYGNFNKRLVKTPRFYYRDSGLLHHLLGIKTADALNSHPIQGKSWEGFVIENIIRQTDSDMQASFYRTQDGAEIDLIIEHAEAGLWAIEIKKSAKPALTRGFHSACETLKPRRRFVIHKNTVSWKNKDGVEFMTLPDMCREVAAKFKLEEEEPDGAA